METSVRKAFIAGKFYPADPGEIRHTIDVFSGKAKKPGTEPGNAVLGAVLPHAGHVYSGFQTTHFFEYLKASEQKFDTYLILHPVHRGGTPDYAADPVKFWETPLGKVALDTEFIDNMAIPSSSDIHRYEHSAEVILPFLQHYLDYPFQIAPVGICRQRPDVSAELAKKITQARKSTGRKICVLASSDFSHYLPPDTGYRLDQKVLDAIEEFDIQKVYDTIRNENISVCGYGPIMALMQYSMITAKQPSLKILARGHSGEVYPSETVVDYISLLFFDKNSKNE